MKHRLDPAHTVSPFPGPRPPGEPRPGPRRRPRRAVLLGALAAALLPAAACHRHHDDDDDFTVVASTAEIEPNDESASPNFLGVLRHGEAMVVEGAASAGADEFDGFAVSLTKPTEIEFALSFADLGGELDVWIYDPAVDDVALFFEGDGSPERGVFVVEEPVLDFQIVVRAFTGAASYRLEMLARPVPHFSTAAPASRADAAGGIAPAPGFPALRRDGGAADRERALDAYLGRDPQAPAALAGNRRVGSLVFVDGDGRVAVSPVTSDPSGELFARDPLAGGAGGAGGGPDGGTGDGGSAGAR